MVHPDNEENQRNEYSTPKLIVYGHLVELTRSHGDVSPVSDGGSAEPLTKTH